MRKINNKITNKGKSKKSQITIFVIIAIIIIAVIATIFIISNKTIEKISPSADPKAYIEKCAKEAADEAINKIIPKGGFLEPTNYIRYDNENVVFICYTPFEEQLCTNNHPMLDKEIENEIKRIIEPRINQCFNDVKADLSRYNYKEENAQFNISIIPNRVLISISKKITFTKNEKTTEINKFDTRINSALYEFIALTNQINNEEVTCDCGKEACNADIIKLNMDNRDFEIERFVTGKNEKVYTIREILTEKEFKFGVRNCVRLP